MLFATFWLLLWRPRTQLGATLAGLFILATALSNPGVWFFAPLAALRAVAARDRRDVTIVTPHFVGALIQVRAVAIGDCQSVELVRRSDIWSVLTQRVVDGAAFGLGLGGIAWTNLGWPFLIVLSICVVVGLAISLTRTSGSARCLAAVAVPTALAMFVLSIYQRAAAIAMLWSADAYNATVGRYSIGPVLLVVSVALVLVDASWRRRSEPSQRRPWPAIVAVALVFVSVATSFSARDTAVCGDPTWSASLDRASSLCAAKHLDATPVPTSPPGVRHAAPMRRHRREVA